MEVKRQEGFTVTENKGSEGEQLEIVYRSKNVELVIKEGMADTGS